MVSKDTTQPKPKPYALETLSKCEVTLVMAWLEIWLASSLTLLMPLSTGSAGQPRTWPVIGQC